MDGPLEEVLSEAMMRIADVSLVWCFGCMISVLLTLGEGGWLPMTKRAELSSLTARSLQVEEPHNYRIISRDKVPLVSRDICLR